ncbi:MAG: flagellar hook-associated protein FlgK [Myxococcota bacterium]
MAFTGLAGLLNIGLSGLGAARAGIATHGRNAANANTPGYVRQDIQLQSARGAPLDGGVVVGNPTRAADPFLSARERQSDGNLGRANSMQAAIEALDKRISDQQHNLVEAIAALFGGISQLEAAPTDPSVRQDVIGQASNVASTFNQAASAVAGAQTLADDQLASLASQASQLASQLADANGVATGPNPDPAALDQRDQIARQLAAIVGGQARVDGDGHMRFVLDGGAVLVDGIHASSIAATHDPALGGHVRLDAVDGVHVTNLSNQINGGQMGGLIAARDGVLTQAMSAIDQLAYDFATAMNAAHEQGQGLDGQTGRDLFVAPTAVDGAAAAMAVDPTVTSDQRALAAGAVGAGPSDNSGARALSALAAQHLAGGGNATFTDQAINILSSVGHAAQVAAGQVDVEKSRHTQLAAERDDKSGVSMEDELASLAQFQHAHEAAARFIQAVDETFKDLLQRI